MKKKHSIRLTRRALAALLAAGMSISTIATPALAAEDEILAGTAAENETEAPEVVETEAAESEVTEDAVISEEISDEAPVYLTPEIQGTVTGSGDYSAEVNGAIVYFAFTANGNGKLLVKSTDTADTYGYLYDADLTVLTYNDDSAGSGQFQYIYDITEGTTYYIGIRYYTTSNSGTIPFTVEVLDYSVDGPVTFNGQDYYICDGQLANGWLTIDDAEYYYVEGIKQCSTVVSVDGTLYMLGEDGALTGTMSAGWNQAGTSWYYVEDGALVSNTVKLIDESYYGFASDGVMYADTTFSMYDSDARKTKYYRANEDGTLCTGWYENENGSKYCYASDGAALEGFQEVDGVTYYFSYDGYMRVSQTVTVDGIQYILAEDGHVTEVPESGWFMVDDDWYYAEDSTLVTYTVRKIDDTWYGFNYNGRMYTNDVFSSYDSETSTYKYYRAKASGALYAGEWYEDEYGNKYYYGTDAAAANGIATVDGYTYYFSYDGYVYVNRSVTVDGVLYILDEDGHATKIDGTGWAKVGDYWYYAEDSVLVTSAVRKINGTYYGFDYNGRMYTDSTFSAYDSEADEYKYYRAKASGALYTGEWYEYEWGDKCYYGTDAAAANGITTVDGYTYYFRNGNMYTNQSVTVDGVLYIIDEDGHATEIKGTGWTKVGDYWYYAEDGALVSNTARKISGAYYGFDYNGRMYTDTSFGAYDSTSEEYKYYRAKASGILYTGEWYEDEWGNKEYYGSDAVRVTGPQTIDSKLYYFSSWGNLAVNSTNTLDGVTYISDSNGIATKVEGTKWIQIDGMWRYCENGVLIKSAVKKINGYYYGFNYNGIMYTDTTFSMYDSTAGQSKYYWAQASGVLYTDMWYRDGYNRYYYGTDGAKATGLQTIGGKLYYFNTNGAQQTSTTVAVDGVSYIIDGSGNLTKVTANGFTTVKDAGTVYYKDGALVKSALVTDNGSLYGFNYKGFMYTDTSFLIDGSRYYAGSDGKVLCNTWVGSCYYSADGTAASGILTIDGADCYFEDGYISKSEAVTVDGVNYIADSNGALTKVTSTGWVKKDGCWYFVNSDGSFLKDAVLKSGSAWYVFNSCGIMVTGGEYSIYDSEAGTIVYYRAKENGELYVNSWYNQTAASDASGNASSSAVTARYYYGAEGKAASGIEEIGGVLYDFSSNGQLVTDYDGIISYNDSSYTIDDTGVMRKLADNGWTCVSGRYYYTEDGQAYTSTVAQINSVYYGFDSNGVMYSDNEAFYYNGNYYRAKTNGSLYVNQWYQNADGVWYYYDETAASAGYGLKTVAGKQYYFDYRYDSAGAMMTDATTYTYVDGKYRTYSFDANGNVTEVTSASDGWKSVNGKWFYFRDGKPVRSEKVKIGAAYYYFDYSGVMLSDTTVNYYDGNKYTEIRAKADGTLYVNEWYKTSWSSYYYGDEGVAASGITVIGGVSYAFSTYGYLYTSQVCNINGKNYVTDASGAATEIKDDTWTKVNGKYYYAKAGVVLKNCVSYIGSAWYAFDYSGQMYADCQVNINGSIYYAGASGALYTNRWCSDSQGHRYYFGENGKAVCGKVVTISGVSYAFDYSSYLYTDRAFVMNHTNYVADQNGALKVLANNAWTKVGSNYYYVKNYTLLKQAVAKIGSVYYGFDSNGKMYTSHMLYAKNENGDYHYYRAKADGSLYVSAWYQDANGEWYYYGADGAAADGICTVNGTTYGFWSDGSLKKNSVVTADGVTYITNQNGIAAKQTTDGWKNVNGSYYYVKDGQLLKSTVAKIDSAYYAFDYEGKMYTYGEPYYNGSYYRVKAGGSLCVNQWYQKGSEWYYYGDEGKAASGVVTISGKKYVFSSDGVMMTDCMIYTSSGYVLADKNGMLIEGTGWKLCGGEYYYLNADGTLYYGELKQGSTSYYLQPVMNHDCVVTVEGELYTAASNGALTKITADGFYTAGSSEYYVKNGALVKNQWLQLNGNWYYFNEYGYRITNQTYAVNGAYYYFDQSGKMLTGGWKVIDSWTKVYAGTSGVLLTGTQTISGKTYYFNSNGYLTTGTVRNSDGSYTVYGNDGALIGSFSGDGWHSVNGIYYYVQNGTLLQGTVAVIGGTRYGFDSYGAMYVSRLFWCNGYRYYANASGALAAGWIAYGNFWYYADTDTNCLITGSADISSKCYAINYYGKLITGQTVTDDKIRTSTASGVTFSAISDGWHYVDGSTYYYKDGKAYTGWVGDYYVSNGLLLRDQYFRDTNGVYWYADANGKYISGKFKGYMYAKSNGHLACDEWLTVGGKQYYFSGICCVTGIVKISGTYYKFDDDGVYLGTVDTSTGWKSADGKWYYFRNGCKVTGTSLKISGVEYAFDSTGVMVTDDFAYGQNYRYDTYYYYLTSGARASYTGWKQIHGSWYYFNDQYRMVTGWFTVGSTTYYQNFDGMVTGMQTIIGKLYQFNSSGALVTVITKANGWYSAGGNWYYFQNYSLTTGLCNIGGKIYAFDVDGKMASNTVVYDYGDYYYVNASGLVTTTAGTYTVSGKSITVDSYGHVMNGVYLVNGKEVWYDLPDSVSLGSDYYGVG